MQSLEQIVKANGTAREDIEGGSFVISDSVRVPIFTGTAGAQIDLDDIPTPEEILTYLRQGQ